MREIGAFEAKSKLGQLLDWVESLDAFFCQLLPQFFLTAFVPLIVLTAVTLTDWLSLVWC